MLKALGLTMAEARLAGALTDDGNIDTYAAAAGLSKHTVRWTLKQIFAKTETHRQSDLVTLLRSVAQP